MINMVETNCVDGLDEHSVSADDNINKCIICRKPVEKLDGRVKQV